MASPTHRVIVTPPPPPELSVRTSSISPRNRSPFSPRSVTATERSAIVAQIDNWRQGRIDIDDTVASLIAPSTAKKVFAREVYEVFITHTVIEADIQTLRYSRQSLYAASIFSKLASCEDEFQVKDEQFIARENELLQNNPQLKMGKL